ncbi:hypothetical protein [Acetivibrio mesophilus]|nr:hypothetical protein [Acetivibrio mesophilus]
MEENRGFAFGCGNDFIWWIIIILFILCLCPGIFGGFGGGCGYKN